VTNVEHNRPQVTRIDHGIIRPVASASALTWFIRYIITEIYSS